MLQSKICQKKIKLSTMFRNLRLKTKIKKLKNKNSIMVSSLVSGPLCDRSNLYKKYIAIYILRSIIVNFILL